ncbi:MAG: 4Fe-4S binding protein [Clostridia bacterium]|nr:4Fe-4S binding protein [Clostridia bacterium]
MAYKITDKCISCGACAGACPMSCIKKGDEKYIIDEATCIDCGTCAGVCPVEAPVAGE